MLLSLNPLQSGRIADHQEVDGIDRRRLSGDSTVAEVVGRHPERACCQVTRF